MNLVQLFRPIAQLANRDMVKHIFQNDRRFCTILEILKFEENLTANLLEIFNKN